MHGHCKKTVGHPPDGLVRVTGVDFENISNLILKYDWEGSPSGRIIDRPCCPVAESLLFANEKWIRAEDRYSVTLAESYRIGEAAQGITKAKRVLQLPEGSGLCPRLTRLRPLPREDYRRSQTRAPHLKKSL